MIFSCRKERCNKDSQKGQNVTWWSGIQSTKHEKTECKKEIKMEKEKVKNVFIENKHCSVVI